LKLLAFFKDQGTRPRSAGAGPRRRPLYLPSFVSFLFTPPLLLASCVDSHRINLPFECLLIPNKYTRFNCSESLRTNPAAEIGPDIPLHAPLLFRSWSARPVLPTHGAHAICILLQIDNRGYQNASDIVR
jgi:hypothetical protein